MNINVLSYFNLKILVGRSESFKANPEDVLIPEFFENLDLDSIVTPVKIDGLVQLLRQFDYNEDEISFLEEGFTNRFDIGYEGPSNRQSRADNIPLNIGSEEELWNKIMKEVKLKRVAGPFPSIPYENFIQSPVGLVPKDNGKKTRLIFHLSYDFKDGNKSLNHHMSKEKCTVKYHDLDYTVASCVHVKWEQTEDVEGIQGCREGSKSARSANICWEVRHSKCF